MLQVGSVSQETGETSWDPPAEAPGISARNGTSEYIRIQMLSLKSLNEQGPYHITPCYPEGMLKGLDHARPSLMP